MGVGPPRAGRSGPLSVLRRPVDLELDLLVVLAPLMLSFATNSSVE